MLHSSCFYKVVNNKITHSPKTPTHQLHNRFSLFVFFAMTSLLLLNSSSATYVWLGLTDRTGESVFRCGDDRYPFETFFEATEPNGVGGEHCVMSSVDFYFDAPCDYTIMYMCECERFRKYSIIIYSKCYTIRHRHHRRVILLSSSWPPSTRSHKSLKA